MNWRAPDSPATQQGREGYQDEKAGFFPLVFASHRIRWYHEPGVAGSYRLRMVFSWGRVGSTGAFSDGLQAEAAAALAKNGGEQLTGEREFALAA